MKKPILNVLQRIAASAKLFVRIIDRLTDPAPRPMPARCGNINALLLHLCDFDYDLHNWVLRWIAYPLRNPGAKMSTCLVINGQQGTGTSLFFDRVVAQLHGAGARNIQGELLSATLNSWAVNARYVVIEASYSLHIMAQLKAWVAGGQVIVERKGQRPQQEPNQMNLVLISDSDDFLPAGAGNRRYVVIEAPPKREQRFYRAVADEISNGGIDAFQHYLMTTLDMGNFDEYTQPPEAFRQLAQMEAA